MKKILMLLLTFTFVYGYIGYDGEEHVGFHSKVNNHGLVLTSTGTTYEIKGYGIGTEYVEKGFSKKKKAIVIYLGKDCDAFSKKYGKGLWQWANGGFEVLFTTQRFAFGRQEVSMDHISNMNMGKCSIP